VYREAGTIEFVARSLLSQTRRLLLKGLHLVGSRTVVVIGLLLACWTGLGAARNLWFALSGTLAEGVVVRQIEELSADWRNPVPAPPGARAEGMELTAAERLFRAVVSFKHGGRSFDVLANARATVQLYPTGSMVRVLFPRGHPERARLRPELPDAWFQAGLLLAATVVGAGSARLWWHLVRRRIGRQRIVRPTE
jgi:hypothetical protein